MKHLYYFIFLSFFSLTAAAQCSFTSTGANPYSVTVEINPTSLNVPGSCPWGYNYTINFDYTITFTGTPPSSNLYNLQGTLGCGGNTHFFNLPLTNASNSGTGVTNNKWRSTPDCSTATPALLGCNAVGITISGPDMANQTSNCTITVLPVELVSFTVKSTPGLNVLEWTTASELNNDFFSVEYSENGLEWEDISRVKGNGTT